MAEEKELEPLWTINQAAKYLSIAPVTVYRWISKKKVLNPDKLVRFSNRVRIPRSEIMRVAGVVKTQIEDNLN